MRGAGLRRWAASSVSVGGATLMTAGLFAAVGAILVLSVYTSLRPMPRPPAVHVPESTAGAEGAAQECVLRWLRAGHEAVALRPCFAGDVDLRDVGGLALDRVARVGSAGVTELAPGYWSVTVAVELTPDPSVTSSSVPSGTPTTIAAPVVRHYQLGIRADAGRYVAVALPRPVPAPLLSMSTNLATDDLERPRPDDPVASVVGLYLAASLAGDGELRYYAFPGSQLAAVTPAPYVRVQLRRIAYREIRDTRREVLAEALGTDAAGVSQVVNVSLEVARRAGRWEVAAELPAPTLSARQPVPSTTAPRPTSTTVAPATTTTAARPQSR